MGKTQRPGGRTTNNTGVGGDVVGMEGGRIAVTMRNIVVGKG